MGIPILSVRDDQGNIIPIPAIQGRDGVDGKDGKDGEIIIYWVSDGGDTKSLYWAGTYVAPKDNKETYSWTSKNNKDKTDHALLASGDDTKVFTYEKGEITYKASALGTTKKMHFVRTDTNYCDEEEEQK